MAQRKKTPANGRKTTGSSTANKKRPAASNARRKSASSRPKPFRRELGGALCLVIGLLSCIGYFNVDALFIRYFCGFIKGIVGWGYAIFPPAVILAGVILLTHRGRPVRLRVFFALMLPLLLGAFLHLIVCDDFQHFSRGLLSGLFRTGTHMKSGGFLAGLLAVTLRSAVSIYGAIPLLLACLILFVIYALNLRVTQIIRYFRSSSRLEYDPEDYVDEYEDEIFPPAPRRVRHREPEKEKNRNAPASRKRTASAPEPEVEAYEAPRPRRRSAIDIPLDEEDEIAPQSGKSSLLAKLPKVKTPDILRRRDGEEADDAEAAQEKSEKVSYDPLRSMPRNKTPKPAARSTAISPSGTGLEDVKPLSLEEAADIAGVPVQQPAATPSASGTSGVGAVGAVGAAAAAVGAAAAGKAAVSAAQVAKETADITRQIEAETDSGEQYRYPPIELLQAGSNETVDARGEIAQNRERLDTTLRSFGVHAAISNVTRGPTVTRYDLELEAGVKLSKLTGLAGDLALSLGVSGVRIAPIPNKISTVGIEVPNRQVSMVHLRDIIDSEKFRSAKSKISFAVGKNIGGEAVVGNIAKLPHMLIAGTTGSGKSVCMNSLILSLLYKATPEEVRLIMIDPKMVELGAYNGIPHLYIPVVTDPKKAAGALQWAVVEMLKRYRLFSEVGVRNLAGYNQHQRSVENGQTLPQVVIVIDELADLMLVASKEVEESICRVAQMGRASGMHLVIATQRPSADVITGLMKANIPSRIAFAVSSSLESRIILDSVGAENLIGNGDMLYAPLGCGKPMRVQGAFVSDEEREKIIDFIKQDSQAQYSDEIMAEIEKATADKGGKSSAAAEDSDEDEGLSQYDAMLPQAADVIFESKQASVSMLQRRLKLGYSRAARLIDQLEDLGVVGPFEGSKPRRILITREQWQEMQLLNGTAPTEQLPPMEELPEAEMEVQDIEQ